MLMGLPKWRSDERAVGGVRPVVLDLLLLTQLFGAEYREIGQT